MVNLGQKGWKQFHLFYFQKNWYNTKKAEKYGDFSAFLVNYIKKL